MLGRLIYLCGERVRLTDMLKTQDVTPETVCELVERGLIVAKLNSEEIDLTPGLIKTHRRRLILRLSKAGESYYWENPHRVLRSLSNARIGLHLSYLLGMVLFEDLAELHREGMIEAFTEDGDEIELGNARQPFSGSLRLLLPGGAEAWVSAVVVRITRAGQLYAERN
ncbi:hypothetical protein M1L60_29715 [Actinoplanes sp. TRM 88003]|uniref:Uncharacterized protein n=1 Tax=Paractinoplanes aksuensis TaxID=2939490 RepID=A0ABT1DYT1_9ACTN|nr:hypothetical protein [Actinoplanes aksuensis]MCO8274781.1 hypothetical protein [Actinoplanes aksuensis]